MSLSTFILTTSPFAKEDIPLASLVPERSSPSTDLQTPYTVDEPEYSKNPDKNFDGLIKGGSETWFKLLLTRFLSFVLKCEKSSTFHVTADEGYIYMLRQPKELFKRIVDNDNIKKWLEEGYQDKQDTWFVIGYRTFVNAKLFREQRKAAEGSGKATAPAGEAVGDASGSIDVEAEGGHKVWDEVKGNTKTTGERIYAICYRKVKITFHDGSVDAKLVRGNKWKTFAATRGKSKTEDEYLEADIENEDDSADCEIQEGRTEDGETLIFGVPSELIQSTE
jgi:hypothetical protein